MDRIRSILGKKIGGVPVLYLVLLGVIGLAAYAYTTSSIPAGDETDADATDADSAGGDTGDAGSQPVFVANPSTTPATADPDTISPVVVEDNDSWLRRTVQWLIAGGYANAGTAQNAMSKYLNAETLSYDEGKLRDAAIKQFGLPPEPPSGTTTGAKPAKRQFSNFPGTHTVQGASDNQYFELAQLYYGRQDNIAIDLIQSKNLSLGHGGALPKGSKVTIPAYRAPKYYKATSARNTLSAIAKANGISQGALQELNDELKFPVKVGTRVRVA